MSGPSDGPADGPADGGRPGRPEGTGWSGMSLFDELAHHAVDDDYRAVAERRGDHGAEAARPDRPRRTVSSLVAVGVVITVFAAMLAVSAVQTRNDRPRLQDERSQLIDEIGDQRAFLADKTERGQALQTEVRALAASAPEAATADRIEALRRSTGQLAVEGDGVRIVVDNADDADDEPRGRVLDRDLQVLVNGLWLAGAEAISINGNRLTTLSSIRTAGEAITVNYRSLTPPYVVRAIGDPRTLESRFLDTPSGQAWTSLRSNYGVRFDTSVEDDLEVPAAPRSRLTLRHATKVGDGA